MSQYRTGELRPTAKISLPTKHVRKDLYVAKLFSAISRVAGLLAG